MADNSQEPTAAWLQSTESLEVCATNDGKPAKRIWFKSEPISLEFCYRAAQLQLCTNSHDQGWADDSTRGSWTWFEILILNEELTGPKKSNDGKEFVWRSHNNHIKQSNPVMHYGIIFDRRSDLLANFDLLANLQPGDILAVQACAQYQGWINYAESGYIAARVLNEGKISRPKQYVAYDMVLDLFAPRWTLTSKGRPNLDVRVAGGSYTFASTSACYVKSDDDQLHYKIWFTTPALDKDSITKLQSIQLFTTSFHQTTKHKVSKGNIFSWFDLVILAKSTDTKPKTKNGVSLVWLSHANSERPRNLGGGPLFEEGFEVEAQALTFTQIKGALEVGDVIGVRVCAQFPGWENNAKFGKLMVRISNEGKESKTFPLPDLTQKNDKYQKVEEAVLKFYKDVSKSDEPTFRSATTSLLASEVRADQILSTGPPPAYEEPLRLLSLDGGGVRGVSSLRILKKIMEQVAKIDNVARADPHQYFDMVCGTSTGGLIALMLGRLKMSIKECEDAYDRICKRVFRYKHGLLPLKFVTGGSLYDHNKLTAAIKECIEKQLHDAEAKLLDETDSGCKVFVMSAIASKVEDGNRAVHLRTYNTNAGVPSEFEDWSIWHAARATSAAPVYFDCFRVDGIEKVFVDGGLGWNNPILELISEVVSVFGKTRSIECCVSIGTGISPTLELNPGPKAVGDYIAMLTNGEKAHSEASRMAPFWLGPDNHDKYFRFNMSKGGSTDSRVTISKRTFYFWSRKVTMKYEDLFERMDDWESIPHMRKFTDEWLENDKTAQEWLMRCAQRLAKNTSKGNRDGTCHITRT